MIGRRASTQLTTLLRSRPVVALLGPRQAGKTTLARIDAVPLREWIAELTDLFG